MKVETAVVLIRVLTLVAAIARFAALTILVWQWFGGWAAAFMWLAWWEVRDLILRELTERLEKTRWRTM